MRRLGGRLIGRILREFFWVEFFLLIFAGGGRWQGDWESFQTCSLLNCSGGLGSNRSIVLGILLRSRGDGVRGDGVETGEEVDQKCYDTCGNCTDAVNDRPVLYLKSN